MLFGTWPQAHAYDPSVYMETRLYKRGLIELNWNTLAKFRHIDGQHFRNLQKFRRLLDGRSMRHNSLIDLESIQHKLSSDYSLTICFSLRFPLADGPSFSISAQTLTKCPFVKGQ